jgi:RNA polymerase II transcription mediator complex subunit 9
MDVTHANTAERHGVPPGELVDAFRVLDGLAEVLGMVLDGQDSSISNASAALQTRFAAADALLDTLPGGDMTREAQLKEAARLSSELAKKRKFLAKHREIPLLVEKLKAKKANSHLEGEEEEEAQQVVDITMEESGLIKDSGNPTNGVQSPGSGAFDGDAEMQHDFAALEKGVGDQLIANAITVEDSGTVPSLNTNGLDLDNDGDPLPDTIIDGF